MDMLEKEAKSNPWYCILFLSSYGVVPSKVNARSIICYMMHLLLTPLLVHYASAAIFNEKHS